MPNLICISELGFPKYFEKVGLAGGICASFAHTILVPMDVLKTRLQISPEKYENSFFKACRLITKEEGTRKLLTGFTPTLLGYFAQGFMKFGLYEGIKYGEHKLLGASYHHSFFNYLLAASSAEVIATLFLCPFEAVRVRSLVQSSSPLSIINQLSSSNPANPILPFYKGLLPILAKQVPYTATQLSVFSLSIQPFYSHLYPGMDKEELSKGEQLEATVACGVFAGAIASLVSHPADTIFTQMNSSHQSMAQVIRRIKFRGMWVGVGTRCVMTSVLSGLMFLVYDSVRLLVGLPTS